MEYREVTNKELQDIITYCRNEKTAKVSLDKNVVWSLCNELIAKRKLHDKLFELLESAKE